MFKEFLYRPFYCMFRYNVYPQYREYACGCALLEIFPERIVKMNKNFRSLQYCDECPIFKEGNPLPAIEDLSRCKRHTKADLRLVYKDIIEQCQRRKICFYE